MSWSIEFGSYKRVCIYSLYHYNQFLVVEHNSCVLLFNALFNALWRFIETPDIELIIKYQNIYSLSVFDRYRKIKLYFAFDLFIGTYGVAITYMTYNAWIRHFQNVRTMPIHPRRRMSLLIWPHTQNRELDIYRRHSNPWFFSHSPTNTCLVYFIWTCRS